jgi:hypothetical protein
MFFVSEESKIDIFPEKRNDVPIRPWANVWVLFLLFEIFLITCPCRRSQGNGIYL